MDLARYDNHCQKIFYEALQLAEKRQHSFLEVEHVAYILVHSHTELVAGGSQEFVVQAIEKLLGSLPRIFGRTKAEFGLRLDSVLDMAEESAGSKTVDVPLLWKCLLQGSSALRKIVQEKGSKVVIDVEVGPISPPRPNQASRDKSRSKKDEEEFLLPHTHNLTAAARADDVDPVIGRDVEVQRILEILGRKKKNNPLLLGHPGVGKTAVVEALAQRIVRGDVPPSMRDKIVMSLDLASLLAGAKFRGEFEERLEKLLQKIAKEKGRVILFIDEMHMVIGAGNPEGGADLANLLKPALSRGGIHCIGATTFEEYRRHIEKDAALERRFQPVTIDEPTPEVSLEILRGLRNRYEAFHGVDISDDAMKAAVHFAARYLPARRFPDKAIDLVDEAASRLKIAPAGGTHKALTREDLAAVVAGWSGIPVGKILSTEAQRLQTLHLRLKEQVFGQEEGVDAVCRCIKRARLGIQDHRRPQGVFLFLGPTGVGKTELAKALAKELFDSEKNMIRFDMSEYAQEHQVAKLIGAPPGYVGFSDGGELTEAVRRKPFSVVLFDELEKANTRVLDVLLQLFEDGRLTDGKGVTVQFTNCIFIMTSNLRSESADVRRDLAQHFRPEFVNRIDEVVAFKSLGREEGTALVEKFLRELNQRLHERHVSITLGRELSYKLAHSVIESEFGGRHLRRLFHILVVDALADRLLREPEMSGRWQLEIGADGQLVWHPETDDHFLLQSALT